MKTPLNKNISLKALLSMVVIAFLFAAASCGGGAKQADTDQSEAATKDETFKSVTKYPIPTTFEVIKLLNKAGASYILSLNNPVENADKYFTEKSKALNLGIYGADLSYASTYQMKQETMNYLKVSKKLIEDLQISTAFNQDFAQKVEDNIDNKDTLIQVITDSFYDTYEFLINEGKDNLSLLVMVGSWTEGLYITSQMAVISKENQDLTKIIANQKDPLNKLFELMESVSDDAAIAEVMEQLKPLKDIYDGVNTETLTQEQFVGIEQTVSSIRETFVK